jgi:LmbE family N-acetylglucosaminyl deacetylase
LKVLIISPHPDDMEVWAGGTAAKFVKEGHRVRSVIITDGRRSLRNFKISDEEMAKLRQKEGEKAYKILGISDFEYFGLVDIKDKRKVGKIITGELKGNYNRIYIPNLDDLHPTHSEIAKMVLGKAKALKIKSLIFSYDGWNFLQNPDEYIDIENFINQKDKAIKCHQSQIKGKPYDKAAKCLARLRAIMMNPYKITKIKYAEAFKRKG